MSIPILQHNWFSLNHQTVAGDCVSGGDRGDYPLVLLPAATSLPGSTWTPQQAACARGNHTTSSTSRPDIMVDKFSDGSNCQYITVTAYIPSVAPRLFTVILLSEGGNHTNSSIYF